MFGHAAQPSRIYAFGAEAAVENANRVHQQLDRARRYRNTLVELELWRRDRTEAALDAAVPELPSLRERAWTLEAELEEERAAIRRRNARRRSKDPEPRAVRAVAAIQADLWEARAVLKSARKAAFATPAVRASLDALDKEHRDRTRRLRGESGVYWGTYLTVEQGLRAARSGAPPRFVGREWPGKIAVQLQGGATWDEVLEGNGQCRVEILPLPPGAAPGGRRSKRPPAMLHIRVGSEGPRNRTPIMATVPFVLHRPIPDDARIKWVYVTRRRVGTHDDWSVQFVVSRESWERADTADARGAVALDLGWRALEDGSLRVAYLLDDHGTSAELTIPAGQVARWGKADELRSIRDDLFRVARARLDDWLAITEVPAWLSDGIAALPRRGSAALAGLVLRWRDHRFPGDEDIHQALETWRKRDKHLLDWEAHQRRRSLRWRDDHYRRFATALRRRYQTVLVEDTDWGRILAMPPAEADTDSLNTRYHARIAAPGRLRELIEEGCERVVRVPARDSTRRCSTCGEHPARDWDPISEIDYRCAAGHRLDQDRNAARNRLREAAGALAG